MNVEKKMDDLLYSIYTWSEHYNWFQRKVIPFGRLGKVDPMRSTYYKWRFVLGKIYREIPYIKEAI